MMSRQNVSPIAPGLFRLKTSMDLLNKIVTEARAFRESLCDDDRAAFNICLSIAHWPEWYAGDVGSKLTPPLSHMDVRNANFFIKICVELANNAKHWGRRDPPKGGFMVTQTAVATTMALSALGEPVQCEGIVVNIEGLAPNMPVRDVFDSAIREMAKLLGINAAPLLS